MVAAGNLENSTNQWRSLKAKSNGSSNKNSGMGPGLRKIGPNVSFHRTARGSVCVVLKFFAARPVNLMLGFMPSKAPERGLHSDAVLERLGRDR